MTACISPSRSPRFEPRLVANPQTFDSEKEKEREGSTIEITNKVDPISYIQVLRSHPYSRLYTLHRYRDSSKYNKAEQSDTLKKR
jgi:hypothetical protein